jgi:hypothetical protein
LIRQAFGVENNPFISNKLVMDVYVKLERRKEFIVQGLRWFDIKRFELEVEHDLVDGSTIKLDQNDKRKVLQIPVSAVDVGKLEPNPR